ncbi:MAG: polyamine aminopropyltransferase [Defluviitaleaceae bacterium]|nr:polyamine aminopropyltransferase [Defluviitaleaceae bacterium]MCL2263527.1 polyamine aminopropyltransferase [Defluviitaleaceae bacterium]
MELWFSEMHTPNVKLSVKVEKQLCCVQSKYQRIEIFESPEFGRFLTLDGFMMLTEKDEFIYHEMITHVPMATHPNAENILVVGAGDGGVMRELGKYPQIKNIDVAEIDSEVVRLCKEFLPKTAIGFADPRVNIFYEDGLKFVRSREDEYDIIIVDSTDPFGPGEGLFSKEFYGNCFKALKADGILINQHESPFYEKDAQIVKRAHKRIVESFEMSRVYQAHIPTYPSGHWLFGFASKGIHPSKDLDDNRWNALQIPTRYYNTNLHQGAFYLPCYVEELLSDVED